MRAILVGVIGIGFGFMGCGGAGPLPDASVDAPNQPIDAAEIDAPSVDATEIDAPSVDSHIDSTSGPPGCVVSPPTPNVNEGGQASFTVVLSAMPAASTDVTIMSADTAIVTVSPGTLTFTPANFAMQQFVTIDGIQDADAVDDIGNVTCQVTGGLVLVVTVSVNDDD